jgi:hypothetical protein
VQFSADTLSEKCFIALNAFPYAWKLYHNLRVECSEFLAFSYHSFVIGGNYLGANINPYYVADVNIVFFNFSCPDVLLGHQRGLVVTPSRTPKIVSLSYLMRFAGSIKNFMCPVF